MLVIKHVLIDHQTNSAELNDVLKPSFLIIFGVRIFCVHSRIFLSVSGVAVMTAGAECLIGQCLLSTTEEICCHLGCVKS